MRRDVELLDDIREIHIRRRVILKGGDPAEILSAHVMPRWFWVKVNRTYLALVTIAPREQVAQGGPS
jgi:hypothetical protein